MLPYPVAGKLEGDPAAPVPLLLRPEDRRVLALPVPVELCAAFAGEFLHPLTGHLQVLVLAEGVERYPYPEPAGEGYLLFHRLAVVDLPLNHHCPPVVALVF